MADDIRQNISVTADVKQLRSLSRALKTYAKNAQIAASATEGLNTAAKGNPTQALNNGLQLTATVATRASTSLNKTSKGVQNVARSTKSTQTALAGLTKQLTALTRITFIQVFLRGFFQLKEAISNSINGVGEFTQALAEIQTISGDATRSLSDMAGTLTAISSKLGVERLDLAAASYQALSAQVVNTANVFPFIETAAKLSVATLSETKEVVDALATVMNSFGATAGSVDDIAGKLFKTVELGRVRMGELSKVIGRVAPLASELGISLDETLAGLAALTTGGQNAAEAGTLLSNVMLKLIKPTTTLKKVFETLGVQTGEVLIAQEGFRGALERIQQVGGSTSAEMGQLFGRIRALRAALSLTGKQAKEFDSTLQKIKDAGVKDLAEAFEKIRKIEFQQLKRNLNDLTNTIQDTFGLKGTQAINKFFSAIGGADKIFNAVAAAAVVAAGTVTAIWVASMRTVSFAIVGTEVVAVKAAATMGTAFTAALGPGGIILTAAAVTAGVLTKLYLDAQQEAKDFLKEQKRLSEEAEKSAEKSAKSTVKLRQEIFDRDLKVILKLFDKASEPIQAAIEGARVLTNIFKDDLGAQIEDKIKKIQDVVKGVRDIILEARDGLARLPERQAEANRELKDFDADRAIDSIENRVTASDRALQTAAQRRREAFAASTRGLQDEAEAAFESARAFAQRAESLAAGQKGGRGAENRAIQLQRNLIQDQVTLEKNVFQARLKNEKAASRIASELNIIGGIAEDAAKKQIALDAELRKGVTASRKEQIDKEKAALAETLEQAFAKSAPRVQALAKLGFADLADSLRVGPEIFDPITGNITSVADATRAEIQKTNDFIKAQMATLDPVLQDLMKRMNLTLTVEGIPLAKQQLVEFGKEARELADTWAEFSKARSTVLSERGVGENTFKSLQGDVAKAPLTFLDPQGGLTDEYTKLKEAYTKFVEAVERGDLKGATLEFRNFSTEASTINDELGDNFQGIQGKISSLQGSLEKSLRALNVTTNKETKEAVNRFNEIQGAVDRAKRAAPEVKEEVKKIGTDGATAMGDGLTKGANVGIAALDALGKKAIETAQLVARTSAGGGAASSHFGGYRAFGGRGLDRTLVAMEPGEFVSTSAATKRFFPQLQAANAGVTPQFKQQGGSVHNEIGNISVNVTESATPRTTARQVVSEIKREMRRGTTFFRGN
jgi:TP901 family phage tail tape measure protein